MEKHFDVQRAREAQDAYCERKSLPHFAPFDGYCFYCGNNIYAAVKYRNGSVGGVSVEDAGNRLITGCPHCRRSFCE